MKSSNLWSALRFVLIVLIVTAPVFHARAEYWGNKLSPGHREQLEEIGATILLSVSIIFDAYKNAEQGRIDSANELVADARAKLDLSIKLFSVIAEQVDSIEIDREHMNQIFPYYGPFMQERGGGNLQQIARINLEDLSNLSNALANVQFVDVPINYGSLAELNDRLFSVVQGGLFAAVAADRVYDQSD